MLIAQITDMHVKPRGEMLSGTLDSLAALARALARIDALAPRPDLLVATGDLTADGRPEEYAALRDLLAGLRMPWLLLPGNHDDRDTMRAAFPEMPWDHPEFLLWAADRGPLRLVALDSVIPGDHRGELCGERLGWLDRALAAAPDRPTVVMMHHPPFATGIGHLDRMGLVETDGLAAVIRRHRQVVRILCGHVHRPIQTMFAGVLASVAPATSFQIQLKLESSKGIQWTREPPAFQLHQWGGGAMVSHTAYVEDFGHWERPESYRAMESRSGLASGD